MITVRKLEFYFGVEKCVKRKSKGQLCRTFKNGRGHSRFLHTTYRFPLSLDSGWYGLKLGKQQSIIAAVNPSKFGARKI
jgi:hypothetical protein